jgi:tRNA-binding protein
MQPAPVKPTIPFSQFESIDIRAGTIVSVSDVPASKKLVRFIVDFGDQVRSVVAGMKQERDDLDSLVGVQTLFVVNIEPRTMAGVLSEAMFFDLGYADGIQPALALPERRIPNGTRAG